MVEKFRKRVVLFKTTAINVYVNFHLGWIFILSSSKIECRVASRRKTISLYSEIDRTANRNAKPVSVTIQSHNYRIATFNRPNRAVQFFLFHLDVFTSARGDGTPTDENPSLYPRDRSSLCQWDSLDRESNHSSRRLKSSRSFAWELVWSTDYREPSRNRVAFDALCLRCQRRASTFADPTGSSESLRHIHRPEYTVHLYSTKPAFDKRRLSTVHMIHYTQFMHTGWSFLFLLAFFLPVPARTFSR